MYIERGINRWSWALWPSVVVYTLGAPPLDRCVALHWLCFYFEMWFESGERRL
jgi:hypothetical protein